MASDRSRSPQKAKPALSQPGDVSGFNQQHKNSYQCMVLQTKSQQSVKCEVATAENYLPTMPTLGH